jgi:Fe-S cluster assembly protein SufD
MSALERARDRYLEAYRAFERERAGEPDWLARLRTDAITAFRETGLPGTSLEEWRYTNVAQLAELPFVRAGAGDGRLGRDEVERLAFPVFACGLYVFEEGRLRPEVSAPEALVGQVQLESLAALAATAPDFLAQHLGALAGIKEHPFAALNTAFIEDGAVLRVPAGIEVGTPIHVVFVSLPGDGPLVSHPRVLIDAERGSRVSVIVDHVSLGSGAGFTNAVNEVRVAENAEVGLVLLQRERDEHFHVSNLAVRQERDSRFSAHTLSLGGSLVRNDASVVLRGEGAECRLEGLFVGSGAQLLDNHTLVDHAVPRCTSAELYKGILGGRARGVFRGRVIVRPDAQKTNARQSNANLLLGRHAEIDTKPQLEIHADDVKCSHGSTIGQLDENALFYLRSRALSEQRARDLLTRAFGLEVLERLPVPGLAEGLDDLILDHLRRAHRQEDDA